MKKSPKPSDKHSVETDPLLSFLELLNALSSQAQISEFCTPGHKAGQGFAAMLDNQPAGWQLLLAQEVD